MSYLRFKIRYMNLQIFVFPIIILTVINCQSNLTERPGNYTLEEDKGIYVEVFDSTNVDENRFTANNFTFKDGSQFIYSYKHLSRDGKKYYFEEDSSINDSKYAWKFINIDSITSHTIEKVKIIVKYGLQPFIQHIPEYNQTIIQFDYPTKEGLASFNSISGVIENEKNIWMHPPRDKYFRILELNPFPFIKAPYEIGNQWNWSLKIGSSWGDKRWKIWEGTIENKYEYKITDKRIVDTILGEIECYEITSNATSNIGVTELVALFNPKYGFVKLNYTNINGSKTILELIEFKEIEL